MKVMNTVTLKILYMSLLLLLFIGASGCNTVKGAGKDIENAGEAIQEGAD